MKNTKNEINLRVHLDEVLSRVCAESAWHGAIAPGNVVLTPDNWRLIAQRVAMALDELRPLLAGYVTLWNYNPNQLTNSVLITLAMPAAPLGDDFETAASQCLTEALVCYVLALTYGESASWYATAWRRNRAKLLLMMAKECLAHDAIATPF